MSENGQPYQQAGGERPQTFKVEPNGNERKITWYFPATTDATRTFELRYTLHGVVRIYPGGDQFYLKFIESDRSYTIDASHVLVHLPGAFDTAQIKAANYVGSSEQRDGARVVDGRTVEFTGGPFSSNREWEIRTQFPHGLVTAPAPSWQAAYDQEQARLDAIRQRQPVYNLIALRCL